MQNYGIPEGQDPEKTIVLLGQLVSAQTDAEDVEKGGTNTYHDFKYATADSLLGQKQALNKHGLALLPMGHEFHPGEVDGAWADLRRTYWLVHQGGAYLVFEQVWTFQPSSGRPWDKALAAALTSSLGYQMRDVLGLARIAQGDDISGRDDTKYDPKSDRMTGNGMTHAEIREAQGREKAAGWLHGCPPISATGEERRAYMEKAKKAKLGAKSLRVIGARLWAMANIEKGEIDDAGMTDAQRADLEFGKNLMMETPAPVADGEETPPRETQPDTEETPPDSSEHPQSGDAVARRAEEDDGADKEEVGKSAPEKAEETKQENAEKPKGAGKKKAKSAAKKSEPAKEKATPTPAPDTTADGENGTQTTTPPSTASGDFWDQKTQGAKLRDFLTFIEGSPSPDDFMVLAEGPTMKFDFDHMGMLSVAIELRKAALEKRGFDEKVCTPAKLAMLRSIVDAGSAAK